MWCAGQDRPSSGSRRTARRPVLADSFEGKKFNGPNDIAIKSNGTIYIADSDVGLRNGARSPLKQMPNNVWMWKDGKVRWPSKRELGGGPNGVTMSPDEKWLYLTAGRSMKRYEIKADDTLGEGTVFTEGEGITDGMKVDTLGNIYSTSGAGPGVVRITSPEGKLLGSPESADRGRRGAQAADLRDQPRVRRRRSRPVCARRAMPSTRSGWSRPASFQDRTVRVR